MYNAENNVDAVSKNPDLKITVEGFQWGWRFTYPNGHQEVGTVANALDINSDDDLPVLVMPADETVQFHVVTHDVVHTFYVPEFLFQRDMIPGINNTFDFNVTTPGIYPGSATTSAGSTTPTCASWSTSCRRPSTTPGTPAGRQTRSRPRE